MRPGRACQRRRSTRLLRLACREDLGPGHRELLGGRHALARELGQRGAHRTLDLIRTGGCEAGVALNPTTPPESIEWALPYVSYVNVMSVNPGFGGQAFIPEMVEKVRRLKEMTDIPVEVDGGITVETAPLMVRAGAQVLVAGSAVFKGDPAAEMRRIIEAGKAASQHFS